MSSADSYASLMDRLQEGTTEPTNPQTPATVDRVWIELAGRLYVSSPYFYCKLFCTLSNGDHFQNELTGDSRLLAVGVAMGTAPAECLWDRLMEQPNEIADCPHPELIPEIIDRLREQYRPATV